MTRKLQKFEENRQVAEAAIEDRLTEQHQIVGRERALVMIGAVQAVNHIASTLSAQTMRALQKIRDERTYEQFGYARFDDFLNESEYSPMSYRQFNDREKLLETEGEKLFDLLNSSSLSHKQRKLLGAGHVQVDEDKGTVVILADPANEEDAQEIELNDRNRLLQTLSALADQAATLNRKNDRQKDQIRKGEENIESLRRQLDDARNRPGKVSMFDAWLTCCRSLDALAALVELDEANRPHRKQYVDALEMAVRRVDAAFAGPAKSAPKKANSAKVSEDLTASFDEDELADLME